MKEGIYAALFASLCMVGCATPQANQCREPGEFSVSTRTHRNRLPGMYFTSDSAIRYATTLACLLDDRSTVSYEGEEEMRARVNSDGCSIASLSEESLGEAAKILNIQKDGKKWISTNEAREAFKSYIEQRSCEQK